MSRDFYELCYDQYKHEMAEAANLYQKAGVLLIVIPLLGAITVTLGRLDVLHLTFTRIDTFLFYLASAVAIGALTASVLFLFLCIYPRKYKNLASMGVWQKWREDYQKWSEDHQKDLDTQADGTEACESLDIAMFKNLCPMLAEAQPVNAEINERRRKAFKRSVLMTGIAIVAVGAEALFYLIMIIQGV